MIRAKLLEQQAHVRGMLDALGYPTSDAFAAAFLLGRLDQIASDLAALAQERE